MSAYRPPNSEKILLGKSEKNERGKREEYENLFRKAPKKNIEQPLFGSTVKCALRKRRKTLLAVCKRYHAGANVASAFCLEATVYFFEFFGLIVKNGTDL